MSLSLSTHGHLLVRSCTTACARAILAFVWEPMGAAVINCWQPAVITDVCSDSLGLSLWAGEMKQLIVFRPPVCHQSQRNHLIWSQNSAPSKWILASAHTSEHFLLTVSGEMVTHLTLLSLFQRSYFPLLSWNKMKLDNNNEFLFTFCRETLLLHLMTFW